MKIINIGIISICLIIFLSNLTICYKKSNMRSMPKSDKIKIGQQITKFQVGKLNNIPDGPMTEQEFNDQIKANNDREGGKPKRVGVVYIDSRIADMPVGQMRIKPKNIFLYFPDDFYAKNYQPGIDGDKFVRDKKISRINLERSILQEANDDPTMNPFKKIYDQEKTTLDYESDVKKDAHKKNLLNLAIDKEEEIFRAELEKENSENFDKKINKGFYDKVYNFRNKWAQEHPESITDVLPAANSAPVAASPLEAASPPAVAAANEPAPKNEQIEIPSNLVMDSEMPLVIPVNDLDPPPKELSDPKAQKILKAFAFPK